MKLFKSNRLIVPTPIASNFFYHKNIQPIKENKNNF